MNKFSLRTYLLKVISIPLVIGLLAIGLTSYYYAHKEAEEVYDAQMVNFARILKALTKHEIEESGQYKKTIHVTNDSVLHKYENNYAYRVWSGNMLILNSNNASKFGDLTYKQGFSKHVINQEKWRFFVLKDKDVTVEVAEKSYIRSDLIEHIIQGIFIPQLFIIPLVIICLWVGISDGIKPINILSDLIRNRNPNKLEPIETQIIPEEISPILDAINELTHSISEIMEKEKNFSNYAAHELRTPLAALKTQIQVALRTKDKGKQQTLFKEVNQTIDRMSHLIDQLLTFVRVQQTDSTTEATDFSAICQSLVQEFAAIANQENRHLKCDITPNLTINGNQEMLRTLVSNLLSNAIKYTKKDGKIYLSLSQEDNNIILTVADDGIGIAKKDKNNIFDTFYRASTDHADGCGLGLAIAKWVADTHHGKISIDSGLNKKGTSFKVTLTNQ